MLGKLFGNLVDPVGVVQGTPPDFEIFELIGHDPYTGYL
jgi:hypothetical protein